MSEKIHKLQKRLDECDFDAWLIEDPIDLYYLTSQKYSCGQIWIAQSQAWILVDGRYIEQAKQNPDVEAYLLSDKKSKELLNSYKVKRIAFDEAKTLCSSHSRLKKALGSEFDFVAVESITESLRRVKDGSELEKIKNSAALLWRGYLFIRALLKEGVTEKYVAKEFEIFCLKNGADALSFSPIIAFGASSALPHYHPQDRELKKGDLVLIDIGVVFSGYASDMTRVVFYGEPDPFFVHWLEITQLAQKTAIDLCRPGQKISALDEAARGVFKEHGVEKYFIHSLGHGIGLEVHESPRIRYDKEVGVLEPGMVITIEPGLYLPGKGGVRYEDMIVVTDESCVNLFSHDKAVL